MYRSSDAAVWKHDPVSAKYFRARVRTAPLETTVPLRKPLASPPEEHFFVQTTRSHCCCSAMIC